MKFLPAAATTSVLIFLCGTIIKEAICINTTFLQEASQENTTMPETLLGGVSESATKKNSTSLNSNTKRTCACDDGEESLICANNGVTYKNTCRFECAKARVIRLRQVKQGRCSQAAGAGSYWQSKSG